MHLLVLFFSNWMCMEELLWGTGWGIFKNQRWGILANLTLPSRSTGLTHALPTAVSLWLLDHLSRSQERWCVRGLRGPFPGGREGSSLHTSPREESQRSSLGPYPSPQRSSQCAQNGISSTIATTVVGFSLNVFLCMCGSNHCFIAR